MLRVALVLSVSLLVSAAAGNAVAACSSPPGDVNGDGAASVTDVQCVVLGVLAALDVGAPVPTCLGAGGLGTADLGCDGVVDVADALLGILFAFGQGPSISLDADGSGCPDACEAQGPATALVESFDGATSWAQSTGALISGGVFLPAQAPQPPPAANGLILHLPLDGDGVDVSGFGQDLDVGPGAGFAPVAPYGQGLQVVGASGVIEPGPGLATVGANDSFTFAAWIRPTSGGWRCIADDRRPWNTTRWRLCRGDGDEAPLIFYLRTDDDALITVTSGSEWPVVTGVWQHVAVTWDGASGELRLYHDGLPLVHYSDITGWLPDQALPGTSADVDLGLRLGGADAAVVLDDVRVYDHAEDAEGIAALAAYPAPVAELVSAPLDAGGPMYSLVGTWTPALPDGAVEIAVSTDGGATFCALASGEPLDPFGACPLGSSFLYRARWLVGGVGLAGLDTLTFEWTLESDGPPQIVGASVEPAAGSATVLQIAFATHEPAVATVSLTAGGEVVWQQAAGPALDFALLAAGLAPSTEYTVEIVATDAFGESSTLDLAVSTPAPGLVTATISAAPLAGQASDPRIGWGAGHTSSHWNRGLEQNFIENPGFEHGATYGPGLELGLMWGELIALSEGAVLTASLETDPAHVSSGQHSQRFDLVDLPWGYLYTVSLIPMSEPRTYTLRCQMKGEGLSGPVRLVFGKDGALAADSGWTLDVGTEWTTAELSATSDPVSTDPDVQTQVLIFLPQSGTLWIDDCELFDADDRNDWALSSGMLATGRASRPGTVRMGALEMNAVRFDNLVGTPLSVRPVIDCQSGEEGSEREDTVNGFFRFAELLDSNPQLVVPYVMSMEELTDLMEYLYGPADTEWGALREAHGYASWQGRHDVVRFEVGNETTFWYPATACHPTPDGGFGAMPPEEYADWVTEVVTTLHASPYWDPSAMQVGMNLQTVNLSSLAYVLAEEAANPGGGKADFVALANYLYDYFVDIGADGTVTTYDDADVLADPNLYHARMLAEAAWTEEYFTDIAPAVLAAYPSPLELNVYEYSMASDTSAATDPLWATRTGLAAGVAILDSSLARVRAGVEAQNYYLGVGHPGISHTGADPYGSGLVRPVMQALQLHGTFVRGELVVAALSDVPLWDPFGPGAASSTLFYGGPGPTEVPYVGVYPFRDGDRWALVLINRHLWDTLDVALLLPDGEVGPLAEIHTLTGPAPDSGNESTQEVQVVHAALDDFAIGDAIPLPPHSATVVVLRHPAAPRCLDEDGDGFGANPFEAEACSAGSTAVDPDDTNPHILPGNPNVNCDGTAPHGFGRREIPGDGIDQDCDGQDG